eukprot:TRINITY_DN5991_c0_g1_i1.p1 TRINITY_DN5991_c0_g1~~TRINITY_DN5991_c0_g1_i1.p1  ORF type:complete len:371 (-),score=59.93 TRINITY_DN5991_c0_g1_i1:293-1405(-)
MQSMLVTLLFSAVYIASVGATYAEFEFPLYKQCDHRWGDQQMGTKGAGERATVCREGCAMTSVSMLLAGLGSRAPFGGALSPGSFNQWLEDNHGYVCASGDCNDLVLAAPDRLSARITLVGETPPPPLEELRASIHRGRDFYLAHVRNASHFVLVVGAPAGMNGTVQVHDPFFNVSAYEWNEVSDVIHYRLHDTSRNIPRRGSYPLYKQCDPRWGNDTIISTTVCKVGCLMSSISMALAGHGVGIPTSRSGALAPATPGSLNAWLLSVGGYTPSNDLQESALMKVAQVGRVVWPTDGMHRSCDLTPAAVRTAVATRVAIANVLHGEHFVLATGVADDDDTLYVNDPGFETATYSIRKDVVGWRVFDMVVE